MAKGGKAQQHQGQTQKRGGGQQNLKQGSGKPSRGCGGCIFDLVRKMIVLVAISSFLYAATFTGYTYHVKERLPTLDEFKAFSTEAYLLGSERATELYAVGSKYVKVYHAQFKRDYLPTIQLYTKKYTKLAVEKAGDLKELAVKYFSFAQKQAEVYYKLALKKIEEFQSQDGKASSAAPQQGAQKKPTRPTAAPTARPKVAPTVAPTTPKPGQPEVFHDRT